MHTVNDQTLDNEKAGNVGSGQLAILCAHTLLVCVHSIHLSQAFSNVAGSQVEET